MYGKDSLLKISNLTQLSSYRDLRRDVTLKRDEDEESQA